MADEQELAVRPVDHVTSVVKSAVGAVPVAGPFLCEVAGVIIPNQRVDRLARFAQQLADRLGEVEDDVLKSKLGDENFTELVEESMRQASRSTSDERRAYIAGVLANGISGDDIDYIETKHLLRLLGDINDIEVVWLRAYYEWHWGGRGESEFQQTHAATLAPVTAVMGSSREELDKAALQESYKMHMERLGLLRSRIRYDSRTKLPEFDRDKGFKKSGYEITPLGQLLIRYIDLVPETDDT